MTEITILSDATDLTKDQQRQLLNLHYDFLKYQRTLLSIKTDLPDLRVNTLFAGNRIAVAIEAGVIVGYCVYRIISGVLKLRTLFVSEANRRTGVMNSLIELINAREVYLNAELSVYNKCTAARALFTRLGYAAKELDGWFNLFFDKRKTLVEQPSGSAVTA